jgi:phosphoribosylglycinamide formyltransferase-1
MAPAARLRVVVLVSGSGSNLQALIDAASRPGVSGVDIVAVGADRGRHRGPGAGRAATASPRSSCRRSRVPDPSRLGPCPRAPRSRMHAPDLVVSAGFMKILGPARCSARHRVLNTHPALLPSFPGAHGVRDALAHGVKVTGCTCHWVDAGVDTGAIIDQRAVRVAGRRHRGEPARTDQGAGAGHARGGRALARRRPLVAGRLSRWAQPPRERSRAAMASGRASLTQPPTPLSDPARNFSVPGARNTETTWRCRRETARPWRTGAWCQAAM